MSFTKNYFYCAAPTSQLSSYAQDSFANLSAASEHRGTAPLQAPPVLNAHPSHNNNYNNQSSSAAIKNATQYLPATTTLKFSQDTQEQKSQSQFSLPIMNCDTSEKNTITDPFTPLGQNPQCDYTAQLNSKSQKEYQSIHQKKNGLSQERGQKKKNKQDYNEKIANKMPRLDLKNQKFLGVIQKMQLQEQSVLKNTSDYFKEVNTSRADVTQILDRVYQMEQREEQIISFQTIQTGRSHLSNGRPTPLSILQTQNETNTTKQIIRDSQQAIQRREDQQEEKGNCTSSVSSFLLITNSNNNNNNNNNNNSSNKEVYQHLSRDISTPFEICHNTIAAHLEGDSNKSTSTGPQANSPSYSSSTLKIGNSRIDLPTACPTFGDFAQEQADARSAKDSRIKQQLFVQLAEDAPSNSEDHFKIRALHQLQQTATILLENCRMQLSQTPSRQTPSKSTAFRSVALTSPTNNFAQVQASGGKNTSSTKRFSFSTSQAAGTATAQQTIGAQAVVAAQKRHASMSELVSKKLQKSLAQLGHTSSRIAFYSQTARSQKTQATLGGSSAKKNPSTHSCTSTPQGIKKRTLSHKHHSNSNNAHCQDSASVSAFSTPVSAFGTPIPERSLAAAQRMAVDRELKYTSNFQIGERSTLQNEKSRQTNCVSEYQTPVSAAVVLTVPPSQYYNKAGTDARGMINHYYSTEGQRIKTTTATTTTTTTLNTNTNNQEEGQQQIFAVLQSFNFCRSSAGDGVPRVRIDATINKLFTSIESCYQQLQHAFDITPQQRTERYLSPHFSNEGMMHNPTNFN